MMQVHSEDIDKLHKLTTQLHAAVMIISEEGFWHWHPEIRTAYLWLVTDMSQEARDILRTLKNARNQARSTKKSA